MVVAILCVGLITLGWKVVNWVWLKPKKLERYLRQQGLSGNSYRPLIGDLTDNFKMTKEALSKPMEFSHDIVPHVFPLLQETFNKYGTFFHFLLSLLCMFFFAFSAIIWFLGCCLLILWILLMENTYQSFAIYDQSATDVSLFMDGGFFYFCFYTSDILL